MVDKLKKNKGEETRKRVFHAALGLFRKHGFENTSMRDIAKAAELTPGAAYHYFPSKESLVLSYYEWMQDEHEQKVKENLSDKRDVASRLEVLLLTKLKLLRKDRKLLAALFASLGNPSHPLSFFGKKTGVLRNRSVAQFHEVFDDLGLPEDIKGLAGYSAWLAHLALFLFFVYDNSKQQERSHILAASIAEGFGFVMPLLKTPMAKPVITRALKLTEKLGLEVVL